MNTNPIQSVPFDVPEGTTPELTVAVFPGFSPVVVTKTPGGFAVESPGRETWFSQGEETAEFAAAVAVAVVWATEIYEANL